MVILDKANPGANDLIRLRDLLLEAQGIAEQLQRQVGNSTDEQIEFLHGVPAESVVSYKTVLADVLSNLQAPAVETLLGNVA